MVSAPLRSFAFTAGLALLLVACSTTPPARDADGRAAGRRALADTIRASLREELLEPWYPRAVDTVYGGFLSNLAHDWTPAERQDKFIVTQARHVWMTARAAGYFPEQREAYLAMARQGVDFLREHLWDDEHGGFHALVSREGRLLQGSDPFTQGKTAYGNAFGIYGLAAYYAASGDTAALHFAQRAFRWLDEHAHDPRHGGYYQFVERDGTPRRTGWGPHPAKDQNSSIHLLEAFTELYHVWPDSVLRDRLAEMLTIVRDTIVVEPGTLQLFSHEDWTPLSFRDSSEAARRANLGLDHVSFGHDVETAFLMLEAAEALGLDPAPTLAAGKRMVDHALAHGWDDAVGGFFDGGLYVEGREAPEIVLEEKAWWSQAEGLNTLLLLADHYPDDERRYYARFEEMWAYIDAYLVDHEHGGWYVGGLDRDPELREAPKGSIWKAAYHDGRALMNVARRLAEAGE